MSEEQQAYILGTDREELLRLGIQHQVWAEEAVKGWELAGFSAGQTLLDLGSGPGYCSLELAYIAGQNGKVIAVDKSESFIDHLDKLSELQQLNIDARAIDFDQLELEANSLDGMYCRWALAWLPDPKDILEKVFKALKPAGRMVIHEYYDWSTHQIQPPMAGLNAAIAAALRSFKESEGEIDIGRQLPGMLNAMGMKVNSIRLMPKLAQPNTLTWQWPKTFYHSYFPRLVRAGYLSDQQREEALTDMEALERTPGATLCCPLMVEVIAEKL